MGNFNSGVSNTYDVKSDKVATDGKIIKKKKLIEQARTNGLKFNSKKTLSLEVYSISDCENPVFGFTGKKSINLSKPINVSFKVIVTDEKKKFNSEAYNFATYINYRKGFS